MISINLKQISTGQIDLDPSTTPNYIIVPNVCFLYTNSTVRITDKFKKIKDNVYIYFLIKKMVKVTDMYITVSILVMIALLVG